MRESGTPIFLTHKKHEVIFEHHLNFEGQYTIEGIPSNKFKEFLDSYLNSKDYVHLTGFNDTTKYEEVDTDPTPFLFFSNNHDLLIQLQYSVVGKGYGIENLPIRVLLTLFFNEAGQDKALTLVKQLESLVEVEEYEDLEDGMLEILIQSQCDEYIRVVNDYIECPLLDDIVNNYPQIQEPIQKLLTLNVDNIVKTLQRDGRLLLMNGSPGCGKTSLVKALTYHWRKWTQMVYIADVDRLLSDSQYMQQFIIEARTDTRDVVHVYVLEDVDTYISKSSKIEGGNCVARLLNVLDGILGNNMAAIFILTANEEDEGVHEAFSRKGRCLAALEFSKFTHKEAQDWLINKGIIDYELPHKKGKATSGFNSNDSLVKHFSLAELYAIYHEQKPEEVVEIKDESTTTTI